MAGIALVISILGVGLIARSVTRPLQHLTAALRRVSEGDYHGPVEIGQKDEIGELAAAFNRMVEGLAERDRVRDLLGKVMSPQIACELLGGDVELGGEERTVTVLFADVRDFTTLSEKLAARELLALLNEYLTEMSDVIEANDGVVDKYIGDAIMALFGAPLARPNDARAIRAALGMDKALDALNFRIAHLRQAPPGPGWNGVYVSAKSRPDTPLPRIRAAMRPFTGRPTTPRYSSDPGARTHRSTSVSQFAGHVIMTVRLPGGFSPASTSSACLMWGSRRTTMEIKPNKTIRVTSRNAMPGSGLCFIIHYRKDGCSD